MDSAPSKPSLLLAAGIAVFLGGIPPLAATTVLVDDTFARTGTLDGSAPTTLDPSLSGLTWTASTATSGATNSLDGTSLTLTETDTHTQTDFLSLGTGYFANTPGVYTLSISYTIATGGSATSNGWFGFGFVTSSATAIGSLSSGSGYAWALNRRSGLANVYAGSGATNPLYTDATGIAPAGNANQFTLVLNTLGTQWTLDAFLNGTQIDLNASDPNSDTYTFASKPALTGIALGSASGTANLSETVTDFSLTYDAAPVPEPGAWSLAAFGAAALLLRLRRRAA